MHFLLSVRPIVPFKSHNSTNKYSSAALAWGDIQAHIRLTLWNWDVTVHAWKQMIFRIRQMRVKPDSVIVLWEKRCIIFPRSLISYRVGDALNHKKWIQIIWLFFFYKTVCWCNFCSLCGFPCWLLPACDPSFYYSSFVRPSWKYMSTNL